MSQPLRRLKERGKGEGGLGILMIRPYLQIKFKKWDGVGLVECASQLRMQRSGQERWLSG